MMKKIISIILALAMVLSLTAAVAETEIDGLGKRDIKINSAGLNEDPEELIAQGISPTTGRNLDEISVPNGYVGAAVTYSYTPVMVMISNAGGGGEVNVKGRPVSAPIGGDAADVIYEALQATSSTRMAMVFSDTIPDYVGFMRSTRLTHVRLRQEWECAFCTSGYSEADVPGAWKELGVKNPASGDRTKNDPGYIYVGGNSNKIYSKDYYFAVQGISGSNDKVFKLSALMQDQYTTEKANGHTPANHTWKFTDAVPEGGDEAEFIYVNFGDGHMTNSRLEYDEESKTYHRYVQNADGEDVLYQAQVLVNPRENAKTKEVICEDRVFGEAITFSNVIVQAIDMNWLGAERPDPTLTGTGNADYFMCGKHYAGVWERKDINSRTVFYDANGNEIEMQRGRTLIILMNYSKDKRGIKYE